MSAGEVENTRRSKQKRKTMSVNAQPETKTQSQGQTQSQVSLKLVIDKKGKRILYAEADKKFIDFLFAILSLPLVTVVKLLSTAQGLPKLTWSLGSLFRSVETLNLGYFEPNVLSKDGLLNPKLPIATKSQLGNLLQVQSSSSPPTTYYACSNSTTKCHSFSATCGALCPKCFKSISTTATYVPGFIEDILAEGGYVKGGTVTYMVMDDLTVKPISSSMSTISVLNQLRVADLGQIEEKLIYLDINEGVKLLRASLYSSTVLTNVFLHKIDFPKTPGSKRKKVSGRWILEDDEV